MSIRRLLLAVLLTGTIATFTYAQDGDFRFGFQASPAVTWMGSSEKLVEADGVNLAFKVGMLGEYYFAENYAFKGGLNMSFNQGGQQKYEFTTTTGFNLFPESDLSLDTLRSLPQGTSVRYRFQYVEIPLGLKMRTNEIGYLRYFAEIPLFTLGVNVNSRADINVSGIDGDDENIGDDTNLFNLSWGFGGGVEYSVSESAALVGGLFFQSGFVDVLSDDGADDSKNTLSQVTLRIGVLF